MNTITKMIFYILVLVGVLVFGVMFGLSTCGLCQ